MPQPNVKIASRPAAAAGLAGAAALAFAFLVAWLLSPDAAGSGGVRIDPSEYIDPAILSRSEEFRSGQRWLGAGALLAQAAALAAIAFAGWGPLRRRLGWTERRPLLGAAAVGAMLAVALALVSVPFDYAAYRRAVDVGLSTQGAGPWLWDSLISLAISAALAAFGALLAMAVWRRLGRWFWLAGAALVVGFAVVSTWLWPVVVSPLFNDFEELPPGQGRSSVLRLADWAGVEVEHVYAVDASRRSTALNAYVNGIGGTKRVVIYDNALRELSGAELDALVAHELGHVESRDVPRALLFVLLVSPLGVLFVQLATRATARREGAGREGPAQVLPALALWLTVGLLAIGVAGNLLSRAVEAEADRYAVELTGDAQGLVDLQVKLAETNHADPDPPPAFSFLFGTHPTVKQRIEAAIAAAGDRVGALEGDVR